MKAMWLSLVVLAACAHTFPKVPSKGGPAWRELTSEHFVLWTDLPRDRALRTLRHLEDFRAVAMAALLGDVPPPPRRCLVLAFASWDDWQALGAGKLLGKFVRAAESPFQTPFLTYVAGSHFDFGYAPDARMTVQHELGHLVLDSSVHWAPRFLREGFAEFLATTRFDEAAGRAEIGTIPEERLQWLRRERDFALDTMVTQPVHGWHGYVGSHILVAYLMNRQLERFTAYLRALREASPLESAQVWERVFGDLPKERLRADIADWVRHGKPHVATIELPRRAVGLAERALSDADVLAVRSLMLLIIGGRAKLPETIAAAREAVTADAGNVLANLMLVGLKLRGEVRSEAVVLAHPDDYRAWVLRAVALHEGDEQRAALSKACALAPRERDDSPFSRLCAGP